MILLTHIQHPRYAQAFADYLQTLGVAVHTHPVPGAVEIYLQDDSQWPQAQAELARFLAEPDHERYRLASWELGETPADAEQMAPYYRGQSVLQNLKATGIVTKLVFVLCLLVFIYTGQGADVKARAPLMFFPDVVTMGDWHQVWRWITPAFIHFGLVHFSFNLFSWWIFAGLVERAQSSVRLLGLLLACALASNWTEFLWSRNNFGGLSGVVYGLLGYLWFYGRFNPRTVMKLPPGMIVFMLVALAAGFTNLLPIANMAHLSGLVTGCVLGLVCAKLDVGDQRVR